MEETKKNKRYDDIMTYLNSLVGWYGGKHKLLDYILPFPIHTTFVEVFAGCYDEETELLTKKGWIKFKNLTYNDEVACLDKNHKIFYSNPLAIQKYHYKGDMIKVNHRSVDLLVTPNHNMYLKEYRHKTYEFMKASNIKYLNLKILSNVNWNGEEKKYFKVPLLNNLKYKQHYEKTKEKWKSKKWLEKQYYKLKKSQSQIAIECSCTQGNIEYWMKKFNMKTRNKADAIKSVLDKGKMIGNPIQKKRILMDDWLEFFGWYIAEGWTTRNYQIGIAQTKNYNLNNIKNTIKKIGYLPRFVDNRCFCFNNKQLWSYLKQFGKSYEKYIPQEFMNLSKRQLKILFDAMIKGDGHIGKNGRISYYTASKKLADQLQEIVLKLGYNSTLTSRIRKAHGKTNGRVIKSKRKQYTVNIRCTKENYLNRKKHFLKQKYDGMVYCCTVPNNLLIVRRNGRPIVCGNSAVVTLNKVPSAVEIINDVNSRLTNMWKQVTKHRRKFVDYCLHEGGIDSEELFYYFRNNISDNKVEDAMRMYYINRHSFSQNNNDHHGLSYTGKINWHTAYLNTLKRIDQIVDRFRHVIVKNNDFRQIIKKTDQPEVLMYLDPPYFQGGCYSSDTEILTKNKGWIKFKNLTINDEVACLSQKNDVMYWHKPLAIQKYKYNGDMIKINHRSVDLLVTPNHNMYVKLGKKNGYEFVKCDDIKSYQFHMKISANWEGEEKKWFYPPQIDVIRGGQKIFEKIKMDKWLDFFGWYISEGCCSNQYTINISQSKKENFQKIIDAIKGIGIKKYYVYDKKICFQTKQLWKYLKQLGKSYEKYIPYEFMNLSKRQLKILLKSLIFGDGHITKKGKMYYFTSSEKLANQIQEIGIKCGYGVRKNERNRIGESHVVRNGVCKFNHISYELSFSKMKERQIYRKKHLKTQMYYGFVYDCTVPEHIILVRRNGKMCWCGNSKYEEMTGMEKQSWTMEDFEDLRELLKNIRHAKFVLSIDNERFWTDVIPNLYVQPIERVNAASLCIGGEKKREIEYVIRNFDNDKVEKMDKYSRKETITSDMKI